MGTRPCFSAAYSKQLEIKLSENVIKLFGALNTLSSGLNVCLDEL